MLHLNQIGAVAKIRGTEAQEALESLRNITGLIDIYDAKPGSKEFEEAVKDSWNDVLRNYTGDRNESGIFDIIHLSSQEFDIAELGSRAGIFKVILEKGIPAIEEVAKMSLVKAKFGWTKKQKETNQRIANAYNKTVKWAYEIHQLNNWDEFKKVVVAIEKIYRNLGC